MRIIKKFKCNSCGASLKIDKNKDFIKCEYCGSVYDMPKENKINDLLNNSSKLNDVVDKNHKVIALLIFGITIIIILVVSIFTFKIINSTNNSFNDFDVNSFNSKYEMYPKITSKFFLTNILDDVVTNNKKNTKHLITIEYQDIKTDNPSLIVSLKKNLEDKTYELNFDYDKDGYINIITIED